MAFFAGVQLVIVGILGEYLGRIYREVKWRPLYFVKERSGFPSVEGPPPCTVASRLTAAVSRRSR